MTWVRPSVRGFCERAGRSRKSSGPPLEPCIEILQSLASLLLDVVVERVAVRIDRDGERAEVLDPELPETLGHELLPGDLLDLLDLLGLQGSRAADDREVDHAEAPHGLDGLVRQ